jgi:hypothetical protein
MEESQCPKPAKNQPPSVKAKVAVEDIEAHKTTVQIAQFGVHPTQAGGCQKQALAGLPGVFRMIASRCASSLMPKESSAKQIGQLKVELDFLKKELASSIEDHRLWIDPRHRRPSGSTAMRTARFAALDLLLPAAGPESVENAVLQKPDFAHQTYSDV